MMPIDATGYQQLPALDEADASNTDSDSEAFAALNPRLPHSNLPAGQRPRLLNGVKVFLGPDASDSDSASEEDSPSHDHASGDRVACRHLALCYCLNSLDDHRHAPSADDIKVLRRASQQKLEQLRNELGRTSRALHIVCARDFGVFVRQCFNQMAQELSAPGHGTDRLRLFYFSTGRHGMALRLVCRPGQTTERIECEVSVYDPNFTDHHVQCVVHNLQDFTARPRDHGLLSYLLSREDDEATRQQRASNYFDLETNPGLQVMLYELALDEPRQSSAPLETDWSSSARATLYQAYVADCTHLFQRSLQQALAQAAEGPFPQQLKEAMGFDHSLLVHILLPWVDSLAQLPRWRAVWAQANDELKAHLAAAHDRHGNPLGFLEASSLKPEAVAAWIDVLQSMAPSLALKALSARDSNGNPGLWRALSHDEALRALDPVLQRCAHELPEEVHALLASQDQQGRTALGSQEFDLWPPALPVWVDWLRKWVPEPALLSQLPGYDNALLLRLMVHPSGELMEQWRRVWQNASVGLKVRLLCCYSHGMDPLSFVHETFEARRLDDWVAMLQSLPPEQVMHVLSASDTRGRNALQLALLSAEVLEALTPVLLRSIQFHGEKVAQLLTHADSDHCTALAAIPPNACGKGLGTWLKWLSDWVDPVDVPALLQAKGKDGTPALVRAIEAKAVDWISKWTAALWQLPSAVIHDLLNPETPSGKPVLQYLFENQSAGALKAWFGALVQLPHADQMTALLQKNTAGLPALAEQFIDRASNSAPFDQEWQAVLASLPDDEREQVLQAWDNDGFPLILHAIRAGNAKGVIEWASWLNALPSDRQVKLLQGKDERGASLLAQPWGAPHGSFGGFVVADRPITLPEPMERALQAWMDLISALPLPTQMDILSGGDADGRPWWMAMARRGDSHLIHTVVSELNKRIPPDAREQMVERLGAPGQDLPARLRQDIKEKFAVRSRTKDALQAMGDWLPASLRDELQALLVQG